MTTLTKRKKLKFQTYTREQLSSESAMAAVQGDIHTVRYLLTSTDLAIHADVQYGDSYGFRYACRNGHLEVVHYLLSSDELSQHADIHAWDDAGFKLACEQKQFSIVEYLLNFTGAQYVNFQNTHYNLAWAISEKYHSIIKAMMMSFYHNDMILYLENCSQVEEFCQKNGLNFQKWQEELQKNNLGINPQETILYL